MKKHNSITVGSLVLITFALAACATTGGVDYGEQAAQGIDVFAGKNWNAPQRNNMYDRWEFNTDGTFHFWHVHHGEPLDRGVYRYELKDGIITIAKVGEDNHSHYSYVFSGKTVTLTPWYHSENHEAGEYAAAEHSPEHETVEHSPAAGGHTMGALPEAPVTFTEAR
jgi:predicted small secreted protein